MIRAIFNRLRHGRAENRDSRRDPFIHIIAFGPGLIEEHGQHLPPRHLPIEFRWAVVGKEDHLRMCWRLGSGQAACLQDVQPSSESVA
jgi:hypothetical protein